MFERRPRSQDVRSAALIEELLRTNGTASKHLYGRVQGMSEPIPGVSVVPRRRFLNADRAMVDRFGDPFRPLELDCRVMQFGQPLSPPQLRKAADLIINRPDVELYVYGNASKDLNFLKYFTTGGACTLLSTTWMILLDSHIWTAVSTNSSLGKQGKNFPCASSKVCHISKNCSSSDIRRICTAFAHLVN
jgi:hypothetical protein